MRVTLDTVREAQHTAYQKHQHEFPQHTGRREDTAEYRRWLAEALGLNVVLASPPVGSFLRNVAVEDNAVWERGIMGHDEKVTVISPSVGANGVRGHIPWELVVGYDLVDPDAHEAGLALPTLGALYEAIEKKDPSLSHRVIDLTSRAAFAVMVGGDRG